MKVILTWLYFVLPIFWLAIPVLAQDTQVNEGNESVSASSTILLNETMNPSEGTNSIVQFISIAFENNPRISAAKAEWSAAVAIYPQMRSWPDPIINFKWAPEPIETRNGAIDFGVQLMQMIPNPRKLDLKGDRAITMAEMAQVKYEKIVRDVIIDTTKSYLESAYLHRAIDIASTNRDLFEQMVELAILRETQGELGTSERYMAESRLAQAEYEVWLFHELLEVESANMRKLLGMEPDTELPRILLPDATPIEFDLAIIRQSVLDHRQELEMAGLSVEFAELGVSLAKSLRAPDYSIGFMYNSIGVSPMGEDMGTSGDDAYAFMLGITIPLWGGKNSARISEAESKLKAARANFENQDAVATSSADQLFWQLRNQGRLVVLYRDTLLPEARHASLLAQTWYENESVPFSQLIEARLVVTNFELAAARASTDYLQSLAELERLAGVPLTQEAEAEVEE